MTTEVRVEPHTSDGGQARYYLACARIPFPDVNCSYSVPVILKITGFAVVSSYDWLIPFTTDGTRLACVHFRDNSSRLAFWTVVGGFSGSRCLLVDSSKGRCWVHPHLCGRCWDNILLFIGIDINCPEVQFAGNFYHWKRKEGLCSVLSDSLYR